MYHPLHPPWSWGSKEGGAGRATSITPGRVDVELLILATRVLARILPGLELENDQLQGELPPMNPAAKSQVEEEEEEEEDGWEDGWDGATT
jgi:hypothetical protein